MRGATCIQIHGEIPQNSELVIKKSITGWNTGQCHLMSLRILKAGRILHFMNRYPLMIHGTGAVLIEKSSEMVGMRIPGRWWYPANSWMPRYWWGQGRCESIMERFFGIRLLTGSSPTLVSRCIGEVISLSKFIIVWRCMVSAMQRDSWKCLNFWIWFIRAMNVHLADELY